MKIIRLENKLNYPFRAIKLNLIYDNDIIGQVHIIVGQKSAYFEIFELINELILADSLEKFKSIIFNRCN